MPDMFAAYQDLIILKTIQMLKSRKPIVLITFLSTVLFALEGCVITSTDTIPDTVAFSVSIDKMTAYLSCEGDGTSGTGDIYTRMSLWSTMEQGGQSLLIAELPDVIIGLERNESTTNTGIELSADVDFFDGVRLEAIIVTREVDPNSTQVQELFTLTMKYDSELECWVGETFTEYAGVCVPGSNGGISYIKTTESKMQDHNCDISYIWTAEVRAK
jgi:hypothetical protein